MVLKVEALMEQGRYDGALSYLERYLGRYGRSLAGWRYRVLIRLEQQQRAAAAAEYAALNERVGGHQPEILREVVLGAGGRWLLSDYRVLARCSAGRLAEVSLFEQLMSPQLLGRGSMSKVAVPENELAAIIDSLPGALPTAATWPLLEERASAASDKLKAHLITAAARHLAAGLPTEADQELAKDWLLKGAAANDEPLRAAATLAWPLLHKDQRTVQLGTKMVDGLLSAGDPLRASAVFLMTPIRANEPEQAAQLRRWSAKSPGALAGFALAALERETPSRAQAARLKRLASSTDAGSKLAAATAPGGTPAAVWQQLNVEQRRAWSAVMVLSPVPKHSTWVELILSDSDALVVRNGAAALALLDTQGQDSELVDALRQALSSRDPSSRGAAAAAIVATGQHALARELEQLAQQGDDRSLLAALDAVILSGSSGWEKLSEVALESATPLVRERAIDAISASCNEGQLALLEQLLEDQDPHVAIRAATALYLQVGR
tara:strand:+ start:190 stop:1674 length:1485 start_codon:yes stop_codon:yes gene_type:complete